jgi:hypothetical protein
MSIGEEYIRMMNEEIDGVISEEDACRLADFIERNPEASRYYDELRETVRAIDGTGEVDPPADLRERIYDSVYGRPNGETALRAEGERTFWRSFFPIFAAGVAAGFIIFAAIRPMVTGSGNGGDHSATIGAVKEENDGPRAFDAHGVSGSVVPLVESGSLTLTVKIASEDDASLLLEYGEGMSFESIRSSEGAEYQMEVDGRSLLIVHRGDSEYVIRFRSAGSAKVDLRIFSGGNPVAAMSFVEADK